MEENHQIWSTFQISGSIELNCSRPWVSLAVGNLGSLLEADCSHYKLLFIETVLPALGSQGQSKPNSAAITSDLWNFVLNDTHSMYKTEVGHSDTDTENTRV